MKNTVTTFKQAKQEGTKLTMLTAYDYSTAKLVDEAGVNAILVGAEIAIVSTPDAFWKSFVLFSAQVGGGELAVMYLIGLPLLLLLRKNELGDRIARL